jgi:hypothetical protein
MFPDDNFGYIRNLPNGQESARAGGFGIYYHISYLGRPLAYLWLGTMPPALIWEEMHKAYEHGARRIWIVNVGDIKPAEIGMEFFLQMAWDINRWKRDNLGGYLREWAVREFGAEQAEEIAGVMDQFYRLNFQRKPEHLQWWLPQQTPQPSPFTDTESEQRLDAFAGLRARVNNVWKRLAPEKRDGFFELVGYPVLGSVLANERYFQGERAALAKGGADDKAQEFAEKAEAADRQLEEMTRVYNEEIAGGKWRGLMRLEPADNQWRGMRVSPWSVPEFSREPKPGPTRPVTPPTTAPDEAQGFVERGGVVSIQAENFTHRSGNNGANWEVIPGLGRAGDAVGLFPTTMDPVKRDNLKGGAPKLEYAVTFASKGEFQMTAYLLPVHPLADDGRLRFAVSLDEQEPRVVESDFKDGSAEWAQGVLNATRTVSTRINVPSPGKHTLRIHGMQADVILDKLVIDCGGLDPSYLGPPETR